MSQKTDKMLKLALIFFISLLSFSIGTFVEKKYSDNQHKLAQLEPNHGEEKAEADGHESASAGDDKHDKHDNGDHTTKTKKEGTDAALTDHEVAKIAEEFAVEENEPISEKPVRGLASAPASVEEKDIKEITPTNMPKKHMPSSTPAKASEEKIEHDTTSATEHVDNSEKSARAVASIPATATTIQYTIQVGSFTTIAEAQKLSNDLTAKGYRANFVSAQVNGQTWHRVQVGGLFGSAKEAQAYKKDFLEKTQLGSAIVQRVQR